MSFKKTLLAAGILAAATSAQALPFIEGQIGFGGTWTLTGTDTNGDGKVDYTEASALDLSSIVLTGTGTYAAIVPFTPVTFSTINLDPTISATNPLWDLSSGGINYSFEASSLSIDLRTASDLLLSGSGTLSADGYEDTAGRWDYSSQSGLTFSANGIPVSEPGTLALLGLGLAGLGFARRKTAKA